MKISMPVEIVGTGMAVPERVVTNKDFEARLDTNDEWIVKRTGIRERRWASPEIGSLTLATQASQRALEHAGMTADDIDLIIVATITPEHTLPTTSCELQAALGCNWCQAYDLVAACSGFVYAFGQGAQNVHLGTAKNALVVGVDTMSRIIDPEDRGTAILFGDAAAAVVIRKAQDPERGILAMRCGADGGRAKTIYIPAGGTAEPASQKTVDERLHYVRMQGREVYKFAVTQMQSLIHETLEDVGMTPDQLKLVIPHQSNLRIIESACEKLGLREEQVLINIDRYGNTSGASVAVGLHEARASGRFQQGDHILLVAFGAGLTWASALIRI